LLSLAPPTMSTTGMMGLAGSKLSASEKEEKSRK